MAKTLDLQTQLRDVHTKRRRRRRFFIFMLALAVGGGIIGGGAWLLARSDVFILQEITVTGARKVSRERVLALIDAKDTDGVISELDAALKQNGVAEVCSLGLDVPAEKVLAVYDLVLKNSVLQHRKSPGNGAVP